MRIAIAQLNPSVGDIKKNITKILKARGEAKSEGADIVVFPELFLVGYPLEDLARKPAFYIEAKKTIESIAPLIDESGPAVLIGTIWPEGDDVYNAVVLINNGTIEAVRYKYDLPNYGVFDEKRIFKQGPLPEPIQFRGLTIGLPICEDIWKEEVCAHLKLKGAEMLISCNGSPYETTKKEKRRAVAKARVSENMLPLIYVNQIGGQDELVFDGSSFVMNGDGSNAVSLPSWQERVVITEWSKTEKGWYCTTSDHSPIDTLESDIYNACVIGTRDYVRKNSFEKVLIGLSGGIDSAITAAIAVDALGPENVHCVMLPYTFTTTTSVEDAAQCAAALGVHYSIVPISSSVDGTHKTFSQIYAEGPQGITAENIQSRVRGVLLMAISNTENALVLTTGNKSEMAVGYATIYGDMNGAFNPIKDIYKTDVFKLAQWRNKNTTNMCLGPNREVIPSRIISKLPSAELKPNQTDQDSLPPYEVLDEILKKYIEQELPTKDIVARGYEIGLVRKIEKLVNLSEYKRHQAPPGVKLTSKNFGRDRRYPIVNKFREE